MSDTPRNNLKGLRFGHISVYAYLGNSRWECICTKCNRHVLKKQSDLTSGRATMCDACSLEYIKAGK